MQPKAVKQKLKYFHSKAANSLFLMREINGKC